MSIPDIVTMLQNLTNSVDDIQRLITGFAYVLGIVFIFSALSKLKVISHSSVSSPAQIKMAVPIVYLLSGSALLFMPTMIQVLSNTFFGSGTVLSYASYSQINMQYMVGMMVKTAGLIWFVRGCVLIAHGSTPGFKHGFKGWVFLFAGIFAIRFSRFLCSP